MALKDAVKLARTLANLDEGELATVTTFAAEIRAAGSTVPAEPKKKRKYTKKAKPTSMEEGVEVKKKRGRPKKEKEEEVPEAEAESEYTSGVQ